MARDKYSRTARFINQSGKSSGFDGVRYVPAGTFADPTFLPRLTWSGGNAPKRPFDFEHVARIIGSHDNCAIFCDTGMFDDVTPNSFWAAVTNRPGKLTITPKVFEELRDWLARRPNHPLAYLLDERNEIVNMAQPSDWTIEEKNAYSYYVNLLKFRGRAMELGRMAFENQYGHRPATPDDMELVRGRIHRTVGERGFIFAKKGDKERDPSRQYADEELVYMAVAHALKTGQETYIFTKDEDVLDQYYKLLYLISSHYASSHIGSYYKENFSEFKTWPIPDHEMYQDLFTGKGNRIVARSMELPHALLPEAFNFVPIHCDVLGQLLSSFTFGAETEMFPMMISKASNDGLNGLELRPRNCHLLIPGLPPPVGYNGPSFIVGEDRCLTPPNGPSIPAIEFWQALLPIERFAHIRERHPLQN